MKRIKKLVSFMLTLVMAMAMMVIPASAENEVVTEHTYEIFQIFTGKFTDVSGSAVLTDVKWGQNGKEKEGELVKESTLKVVEELKNLGENKRAEKLAQYANFASTPIKTATGSGAEVVTVENLASGYYLVRDEVGSQDGVNGNYTLYIVQVVNNILTINPKVGIPTVDKKIVVDNEKKDNSNGAIGDTVTYEIVGTMPSNIDQYNTYYYKFTDTLSKGLTYKNDVKVEVSQAGADATVDVTKYFYKNASPYDQASGTEIIVSIADIKALGKVDGINQITAATEIIITYTATINEAAVIGGDLGNPNKVDLTYSNNPNNSGEGATTPPPENPEDEPKTDKPTGKTPESKVTTYTTELSIKKVDEEQKPLKGVKFTLTGKNLKQVKVVNSEEFKEDENGTYYKLKDGTFTTTAPRTATEEAVDLDTSKKVILQPNSDYYESTTVKYMKSGTSEVTTVAVSSVGVEAEVDEDGNLTFAGLSEGDYVLKESYTPEGYNTIQDIEIHISYANGKFTVTSASKDTELNNSEKLIQQDGDNTFSTTIENKKGSLLPSTGGIGTTIFYVVGAVLVIGAGVLLVTKKRMSRAE